MNDIVHIIKTNVYINLARHYQVKVFTIVLNKYLYLEKSFQTFQFRYEFEEHTDNILTSHPK